MKKLGYEITGDGKFVPDKNFEVFVKAWQKVKSGVTRTDVYNELKQEHYFLNSIDRKTFLRMFADPFYCGFMTYAGQATRILDNDPRFTPMVSQEDFMTIVDLWTGRRKQKVGIEFKPMRRFIKCSHCSRFMTVDITYTKGRSGIFYLRCTNKECKKSLTTGPKQVRGKVVTDFVAHFLDHRMSITPIKFKKVFEGLLVSFDEDIKSNNNKVMSIEKQLKDLTNRKNGALAMVGNNDSYIEELKKLDIEIGELESRKQKIVEESKDLRNKIKKEAISFKDFSNLIKNIRKSIPNPMEPQLLDTSLKYVFSNLTIDQGKVVKWELQDRFKLFEIKDKGKWGRLWSDIRNAMMNYYLNLAV